MSCGPAKFILGQHALYGLADKLFRFFGKKLAGGLVFNTAGIAGVTVIHLFVQFAAGEMHALGIDHDDKVAIVLEITEGRLVLATKQGGDFSGNAAKHFAVGIRHIPLPFNLFDRGVIGFHLLKSC